MQVLRRPPLTVLLIALSLSACNESPEPPRRQVAEVSVAPVQLQDVTVTQQYVGQIQAHRHIEIRTPHSGFVQTVPIKSGQSVKAGDLLFQLGTPPADLSIRAPFDGIVGRIRQQQGAFVEESETLTTLSDNAQVRVYFHMPEARYLEYHAAAADQDQDELNFELVLADGSKFHHQGKLFAIAGEFDRATSSITFSADFPNPEGQLRHGQSATVLLSRSQEHALVVPQRATFQVADRRYVYVVDSDSIAHQREIDIQNEVDEVFVVKSGVKIGEKIIVDGIRRVRDGGKVEYEQPHEVDAKLASQTE